MELIACGRAVNPQRLQQLFAIYEAEASDLVAAGLPTPALDFVLKCSHTFNLLEARGVISVTERTATIGRIRALARQVAEAWLAERRALGFPLLEGDRRSAWLQAQPGEDAETLPVDTLPAETVLA